MSQFDIFCVLNFEHDCSALTKVRSLNAVKDFKTVSEPEWNKIKSTPHGPRDWAKKMIKGKDALVVLNGGHTKGRAFIDEEIALAKEAGVPIFVINTGNQQKFDFTSFNLGYQPEVHDIKDLSEDNIEKWILAAKGQLKKAA